LQNVLYRTLPNSSTCCCVAGGVIELSADSLLFDGELRANGGDSQGPRGGGGAGGSVYIQVRVEQNRAAY